MAIRVRKDGTMWCAAHTEAAAQLAAVTAENARLREALTHVEQWWLEEGMKHFNGAPYAMFAARAALSQEAPK